MFENRLIYGIETTPIAALGKVISATQIGHYVSINNRRLSECGSDNRNLCSPRVVVSQGVNNAASKCRT